MQKAKDIFLKYVWPAGEFVIGWLLVYCLLAAIFSFSIRLIHAFWLSVVGETAE